MEVMPSRAISFFVSQLHLPLGFETETAPMSKPMPEDLEPIRDRKTTELQHDRRVKRGYVAVPDVARDTGEVDGGKATFETACHRQLWNAVALAQVFS